jgi:hypothetical protein
MLADGFNPAVAHAKAFIDADAEPVERLKNIFFCAGHEASAIGILDTQQHIAAVLTGKQVVVQGGTHAANV